MSILRRPVNSSRVRRSAKDEVGRQALQALQSQFSRPEREAVLARAPGRLNLLGGHTDYNEGFVLPLAIDRSVYVAAAPRSDDTVRVYSVHFRTGAVFRLDRPERDRSATWSAYVQGVLVALRAAGIPVPGCDLAIAADVPIGAGVSSSAALELATAMACLRLAEAELPPREVALLCQRAENEFVGMRCGILDQFASAFGQQDHVLLIDCRTLACEEIPLGDKSVCFVVMDTKKERSLVGSEYNERRAQCEQAARLFAAVLPGVRALRDVSPEEFERHKAILPELVRCRAEHVVYENQRALDGAKYCRAGDWAAVGELQQQAQASLRDLYEVSCRELEALTQAAYGAPGCYGARLVGAGFGGSACALVDAGALPEFAEYVAREYERQIGWRPEIYACRAEQGAEVISEGRTGEPETERDL